MEDVDSRVQWATENLLENERLTADLDDEAASVLLNWGLEKVTEIAVTTRDMKEPQAYEYLSPRQKAVRRMIREISRWISNQDDQETNLDHLEKIYRQAGIVYGQIGPEEAALFTEEATRYMGLEKQELDLFLTESSQIKGKPAAMIKALRQIIEAHFTIESIGVNDDATKEQE